MTPRTAPLDDDASRSERTESSSDRAIRERKNGLREDIAFFLVSYACAFIILYGFVV